MRNLILTSLLVIIPTSVIAENENWRDFRECSARNVPTVAKHVESLNEGALLIVQSLCSNSATNLMNQMVSNRAKQEVSFNNAYEVLLREIRLSLFKNRVANADKNHFLRNNAHKNAHNSKKIGEKYL